MTLPVFVFGSNLSGIHGAGAAKYARLHRGAQMGVHYGYVGNSFAIPTKDKTIKHTLPLDVIDSYVIGFVNFAHLHQELEFQVTRIGCGLAGLKDEDVAPMFNRCPESNCQFDEKWKPYLGDRFKYWGTF